MPHRTNSVHLSKLGKPSPDFSSGERVLFLKPEPLVQDPQSKWRAAWRQPAGKPYRRADALKFTHNF
jgi:hypothetical protein